MPQHEYVPQGFNLVESSPSDLKLKSSLLGSDPNSSFEFTFEALDSHLFRTTFSSPSHPLPPHPSAPKPTSRFAESSISCSTISGKAWSFIIGGVIASIDWSDTPVVTLANSKGTSLYGDLPFRSYCVDGAGIAHYTKYKRDTLHVGLGEKAAPMNLSNRGFSLTVTDCFGYDVYRTDPFYKHIPLLINATPFGCVATFSTSHSRGFYSVGSEIDGMWGHFKVYRQDYGGLEEYILIGKNIQEVLTTYADLVGYPRLVPRWAFGYIAGGMKYSMLDEPRACDALMSFAGKLKEHDIPCSAFQMSSGYTVAEKEPKTRNVFTWNRHRFPDPKGFVKQYRNEGIRIIANVKPYVLATHPEYQKLLASNAFFSNPRTGKPGMARLWSAGGGESGEGGHLDFTSQTAFQWWYEGVKSLREIGIEGIWNDNNEYCIGDDDWQCALERKSLALRSKVGKSVGLWGRSLHTELMGKSSHDAVLDLYPNERPFILTRSATAGTMRYCASSWGGDNTTSWDGMKGANSLSLNAGFSLIQCYGHDIGGFEGPQPTPELLLRWIQLGIHSPRFAINCFKTDENDNTIGGVIEPWMYPETTPLIRAAIKRRYELVPYLYSLMLESHRTAIPPQRWTGLGYETDPVVWTAEVMAGEEQYFLGDSLLIGGVYEPGKTTARMYLPKRENDYGFLNVNEPYQYVTSGQWIEISSEWKKSIPVLARIGSAIPVGKDLQTRATGDHSQHSENIAEDDYRGIEIFPPPISRDISSYTWYEDDGIHASPDISSFTIKYEAKEESIRVSLEKGEGNKYVPLWKKLAIIVPFGDGRVVISDQGMLNRDGDVRGRAVFTLSI